MFTFNDLCAYVFVLSLIPFLLFYKYLLYRILYIKQKVKYYKSILFILFIYIILLSTYTFCYTKQWKDSTVVREYTKEILDRRLNQNGIN